MGGVLQGNQLLVVVLQLLNHVVVVQQLLHGAAALLGEQGLDALTGLVLVAGPEVAIQESKRCERTLG